MYFRPEQIPDAFLSNNSFDIVLPRTIQDYSRGQLAFSYLPLLTFQARQAMEASQDALSYRGFNVGAVALAANTNTMKLGFLSGFNVKPDAESELNIHAEAMAIAKARKHGLTKVLSLVVFGPVQADQQSSVETKTLHPCGLCRDMMISDRTPEIDNQTMLVSTTGSFNVTECYNLPEITEFHQSKPEDRTPLRTITLADEVIDSGDFDDQITGVLIDYWADLYPEHDFAQQLIRQRRLVADARNRRRTRQRSR